MKRRARKLIALIATVCVLLPAMTGAVSALTFYVGQWIGTGTVTSVYNRTVESGVTYSRAVFTDTTGGSQFIHAMDFNPKNNAYMPLVYSKYSGYGATTLTSATDAEAKGYNVVGGVNASFFSMTGTSCNTYGGVNISNGKIIQGCNDYGQTQMLVFDSAGNSALVSSRVAYSLAVNGSAWSGALTNINIYPETTGTGIYYYDASCGTSTDTNTAGVEIVFNKDSYSELTVGGTLRGTVSAIRYNVSGGGSIGANQFVLYARDSSGWASQLRALSIGATAEITATETVAAAKTQMENASGALVTYGYRIVQNGVNVTSSNGLGEAFNTASAQRSAVGVRADGSMVLIAAQGRTTSYPGLTVYELANLLIGLGCVTGVNLDGGGSTQMTVQNASGSLVAEFSSSRRVANSLLIVQRQTIPTATRNTLASKIAQAASYLDGYVLASTAALEAALSYGNGVYSSAYSTTGDYTKAIMKLTDAISSAVILGYKTGIYQSSASLTLRAAASDSASALIAVPAGTSLSVTSVSGDFGYTKYMSYSGWVRINASQRTGALNFIAGTVQTVSERVGGMPITFSWNAVPGAAGYTYKVIELAGEPDPGNPNESEGAVELAYVTDSRDLSVTIPASSMTDGKYLKIGLAVNYPGSAVWATAYVKSSELPFTDVPTTAWFYEQVKYVYFGGLFSGTGPNTFSPDGEMTRGMMATVLYRLAGSPTVSGTMPFTDVPAGAYYYNGVLWASQNGIVSGYSETIFAPDDSITREQAAVIIYRYAAFDGRNMTIQNGDLTGFADYTDISSWALTQMSWAVDKGIISGSGGYLLPKNAATRVQIATILYNFSFVG